MRRLMWFSVGFAACCAAAAYLPWNGWLLPAAVLLLLTSIVLCAVKPIPVNIAGTVLLGFAIASFWNWGFDTFYLSTAKHYDEKSLYASVELTDYSTETEYGNSVDGRVMLEGKHYRVRVYLKSDMTLSPGDKIEGIMELRSTTRSGTKESSYHQSNGVFLLAYAEESLSVQKCNGIKLQHIPAWLRGRILSTVDAVFPTDTSGFARALLLGDGSHLTYEEDAAFKSSGIRHVIAVSGLHVSILFALIYAACGRRPVITALVGFPILFLFAAVAGFTPSIVRATIMQGLIVLAILLEEEYDPPTALAFSVLVLLIGNPLMSQSVGLQLSVACVAGILMFGEKTKEYFFRVLKCKKGRSRKAKLKRSIATSASISLSSMVFSTILSAVHFQTVSILGVITNLLALWVITFAFYGIMLACVLGTVWLPLGTILAWVVSWLIRYVMVVAKGIAQIPFAAVYTCSIYIVLWMVFSYIVLLVFLISKRRRPVLAACGIVAALVLSMFASCIEPKIGQVRATVMDVGQGQAILLSSKNGNYLVDCGSDDPKGAADLVAAQLLSQGIYRLDGVMVTHYDTDHAGGIPYLLTRIEADALYLPDIYDDTGTRRVLEENYRPIITWVDRIHTVADDSAVLTLVPGADEINQNRSSMCILFQTEKCDILITGDRDMEGELELLSDCVLPQLELLIAGHHGAGDATSAALLNETRPSSVVISVGKNNRYGHPSGETLRRLEQMGCLVLRTDEEGTIQFRE